MSDEDSDLNDHDGLDDWTPTATPTKSATPTRLANRSGSAAADLASSPPFFISSSQAANPSFSNTTTPSRFTAANDGVESSPAADVLLQMVTKRDARRYAISPRADTMLRNHLQALRNWLDLQLPAIKAICVARDNTLGDILTAHLSTGEAAAADALLAARKADFEELTKLWPLVCDIKDNFPSEVQRMYSGLSPSYSAVFNATLVPPGSIMDTTDVIELSECSSNLLAISTH